MEGFLDKIDNKNIASNDDIYNIWCYQKIINGVNSLLENILNSKNKIISIESLKKETKKILNSNKDEIIIKNNIRKIVKDYFKHISKKAYDYLEDYIESNKFEIKYTVIYPNIIEIHEEILFLLSYWITNWLYNNKQIKYITKICENNWIDIGDIVINFPPNKLINEVVESLYKLDNPEFFTDIFEYLMIKLYYYK